MTDTTNNSLFGEGSDAASALGSAGPTAMSAGFGSPQPIEPAPAAPNIGQPINVSQDPTLTALNSEPIQAPQKGQPGIWQRILMGALTGLAGSAGSRSLGAGLAGGAAGTFAYQ